MSSHLKRAWCFLTAKYAEIRTTKKHTSLTSDTNILKHLQRTVLFTFTWLNL